MELLQWVYETFGEHVTYIASWAVVIIAGSAVFTKIGVKVAAYTKTKKDDKFFSKANQIIELLRKLPILPWLLNMLAINPNQSDVEILKAAIKKTKKK